MRHQVKLSEICIVIFLTFITMAGIYYSVNTIARNELILKTYPLQVNLETTALSCSNQSPEWLKDTLKSVSLSHRAPNNQVAYISPQGQLFHCESGYLGFPLFSKKVNKDTRFRFASVSKLWTSDAILDLIKKKKISLAEQALSVLPEISAPDDLRIKQITVGDLLLHRAGFNRTGLMGDEMFRNREKPFCPNNLDQLSQVQLSFDPNTTFSYSNLGYCLLGEIIAKQKNMSYQEIIEKEYALVNENIRFLENKRLEDEAKYRYIEIGLTGYSDIYTAFDYPALASSAGLSGSAIALAKQVRQMINKPQPNILSQPEITCDVHKLRDCYGYAMFPYQKTDQNLKVYFRDGVLPGASSLVVVDEYGGVLSLLSSGQAKLGQGEYDQTKMKIYEALAQWYKST